MERRTLSAMVRIKVTLPSGAVEHREVSPFMVSMIVSNLRLAIPREASLVGLSLEIESEEK